MIKIPLSPKSICNICSNIFRPFDFNFRTSQSNIEFIVLSSPSPVLITQSIHSTKLMTVEEKENLVTQIKNGLQDPLFKMGM